MDHILSIFLTGSQSQIHPSLCFRFSINFLALDCNFCRVSSLESEMQPQMMLPYLGWLSISARFTTASFDWGRISFSLWREERPPLTLPLTILHWSFQLRYSSILRPRYLVLVTLPIIYWLNLISLSSFRLWWCLEWLMTMNSLLFAFKLSLFCLIHSAKLAISISIFLVEMRYH